MGKVNQACQIAAQIIAFEQRKEARRPIEQPAMFFQKPACVRLALGKRLARFMHRKQYPNLFKELADRGDPKCQRVSWNEMRPHDFARLSGGKTDTSFDHARRKIFFADATAGVTIHAAKKRHRMGTLGKKYFEPLRLSPSQQDYAGRLSYFRLIGHLTARAMASPKQLRQGGPAQKKVSKQDCDWE